jgi:hypothetical protein
MALKIVAALASFGLISGCATTTPQTIQRQDPVVQIAAFNQNCQTMKLVEDLGSRRYRLHGCEKEFVYLCKGQPDQQRNKDELYKMMIGGGLDTRRACQVESIVSLPEELLAKSKSTEQRKKELAKEELGSVLNSYLQERDDKLAHGETTVEVTVIERDEP